MVNKIILTVIALSLLVFNANSQTHTQIGQTLNAITTGVPFLMIAPDARAGAMGDAGVATTPDANSIHWNPAKYAFLDEKISLNISYIPWLRNLVQDINFSNISSGFKIDKNQSFALSLMYFSLGNIAFTTIAGEKIRDFRPNEFSLDAAYALKLSKTISGGVAVRYIHSNLTGGVSSQGSAPTHPGNAVAGDISMFYTKPITISNKKSNLSFGLNISNLGTKISYSDDSYEEFLPANLRLGAALSVDLDQYNSITLTADINKLLVPTPQMIVTNDDGTVDTLGIASDGISVPVAVFQSFYDAPGGFSEEMHELTYSVGAEYWYNKFFAIRLGYFDEHSTKGNRKYFSMGIGVKLNVFKIDFAYLMPTAGRQNPLANTLRFTLGFDFAGLNKKGTVKK